MPSPNKRKALKLATGRDIEPTQGEIQGTNSIGQQIMKRAPFGRLNEKSISRYLEGLRTYGFKYKAAIYANLSTRTINDYRKKDPEFAELEERALGQWIEENIDGPMIEFGLKGQPKIIIDRHGDRHEGEKIIYPQLALAVAKKLDPSGYCDKGQLDVKHSGGVVIVSAPMQQSDADLERYARKVENEATRPTLIEEPNDANPGSEPARPATENT